MSERVRLATMGALAFVFAGLLCANIFPNKHLDSNNNDATDRGWPAVVYTETHSRYSNMYDAYVWRPMGIACDILTALTLIGIVILVERIVIYREQKAGTVVQKFPSKHIHLSTALLLTCSTGVILWLNIHARMAIGWPLLFFRRPDYEWEPFIPVELQEDGTWDDPTRLVIDAVVALAILCAIAVASEWLIRRRETRRT